FSSRRRHTRFSRDWSSDVCSSDLIRAIDEFQITGVETTLSFCKFVMKHQAFREGRFDTKFIDRFFSPEDLEEKIEQTEMELLAAFGVKLFEQHKVTSNVDTGLVSNGSQWKNRLK